MENDTQGFSEQQQPVTQVITSAPSGPSKFNKFISKLGSYGKKISNNRSSVLLIVGGLVIGFLLGSILVLTANGQWVTGAAVSEGDIRTTFDDLFPQAKVVSVEDTGSLFKISVLSETADGTQSGEVYATKDGSYVIVGPIIDIEALRAEMNNETTPPPAADVPKTDKPKVELFVMSYCPFGLQAEKAFLPVYTLLKDEADISIKFVHYIMHGEKEAIENVRQYCIQKEQTDKFAAYLGCFVASKGEDTASATCLTTAQVDTTKLDACVTATRTEFKVDEDLASGEQYPAFGVNAEESKGYGVQGSPTLVINGVQVNADRNPEAVKKAVCNAFNDAPDACDTELATTASSAGFGLAEGEDSGASCG